MKKLLLSLLFSLAALSVTNGQFSKIGGGVTFSSGYKFHKMNFDENKSGNLAFTFYHIHKINVPIQISPTFTFFIHHLYKNLNQKTTISTIMFDINVHYTFNALDKFEFYGLAGPDLLLAWKITRYTGSPSQKEKDYSLGLNVGAGSIIKLTNIFDLYAEAKYLISKYPQFMVNAGILINIDWLKKNENTGI
jgi:hypothetical protein